MDNDLPAMRIVVITVIVYFVVVRMMAVLIAHWMTVIVPVSNFNFARR